MFAQWIKKQSIQSSSDGSHAKVKPDEWTCSKANAASDDGYWVPSLSGAETKAGSQGCTIPYHQPVTWGQMDTIFCTRQWIFVSH